MNEAEAYCFHKTFEPADLAPFQVGRHYLLCALRGTIRLETSGMRWTLPPARAALIAANLPISIAILTKLTSASVLFDPSFMPTPPRGVAVFDLSPLARELIRECSFYTADCGPLSSYARTLFKALAAVIMKLSENASPFVLPLPKSVQLKSALALTEKQASGNPVFANIAKATGQSKRALARRFSSEMGMTWQQTLRRIRLTQAAERIASSPAPITEIAMMVGYSSISAFNAAFRELSGMSPVEYRQSCCEPRLSESQTVARAFNGPRSAPNF